MSSGVEFDEDKFSYSKPPTAAAPSGMSSMKYGTPVPVGTSKMEAWLMRHGIKSTGGAQAILIAIIILNLVVTFVVINFFVL
jgi:hypothetical protein